MMVLDMVPRYIWCAVFLLFCTNACSCFSIDDSTCDSPADTRNARTCESLFKIFENALLSNGSNLYKLKKLFYTGPPELASISYYLEFKNISNYVFNNSVADFGTSDELPLCSCAGASILNQTINYMINNTTIRLRYGWTTIDVYNFIHPALLNQLQIQLPFFIMRGVTDRFPFLWNGHNQLPSTNLHLFIPTNSLSCIPCNSQLDGVMKTLTSLLAFYTRSERRLGDSHIPIDADYALDGLLLKAKKISQVVMQSYALFIGFLLCICLFGGAILLAEIASLMMSSNKFFFAFLFKLTNILSIFCCTAGLPLIVVVSRDSFSEFELHFLGKKCKKNIMCAILLTVLFISCLTVQWAFVSSFATFLLSLAYPLHVTTLVMLHLAFMFVLSVTFGVLVSEITSTKNFKSEKICTRNCERICFIIFGLIILAVAILLYISIIFGYAFTVVQRIVPADGVIRGLLFLPSVILFLIGWALKKRYFAQNEDELQIQAVLPLVPSSSGVVSQLGSRVEEIDIQRILYKLEPSIVVKLVTHRATADDRAKIKSALQDWIRQMRCPADQEQDNRGGTSENSSNRVINETIRLLLDSIRNQRHE